MKNKVNTGSVPLIFSTALLLGGCASSGTQSLVNKSADDRYAEITSANPPVVTAAMVPAPAPVPTQSGPSASEKKVRNVPTDVTPLTRLTDLDRDAEFATGQRFNNAYTRLLITSNLTEDISAKGNTSSYRGNEPKEVQSLKYQPRPFLSRYLLGEKYDLNLSVKVKVGDYEATVPLLTLSQSSDSVGEQWSRSVRHTLLNFPLFLVREDGSASIPDVRFSFSGSKEYNSKMAGSALQIAVAGIQQVAPETTVLTKLTAQAGKDKARAIDDAIGKLFGSGLTEEHISHRDIRKWRANGGVELHLHIPQSDKNWGEPYANVGTWRLTFDDPRPSIFSDWRICTDEKDELRCKKGRDSALKAVHSELNVNQVLAYPLIKEGNGMGSMRAYILQQNWYTSALSAFNGTKEADKKIANDLCRNVMTSITELGLNGDDAKMVVYAMIHGLPVSRAMEKEAFKSAESCKSATDAVEKNRM